MLYIEKQKTKIDGLEETHRVSASQTMFFSFSFFLKKRGYTTSKEEFIYILLRGILKRLISCFRKKLIEKIKKCANCQHIEH